MTKPSKTLGIISGMGSRAGVGLMKKIIDLSPAVKDQEFIEVVLHNNSSIPDRTKAILYGGDSPETELKRSISLMNQCNVDLLVWACITSYYYYECLKPVFEGEILNPIHLADNYIHENFPLVRRVGVLATSGTLYSGLFHRELERGGLTVITLNERDQEEVFMRAVYMENGLKSANISEEAICLMTSCMKLLKENGAEIIIGGCTEVQLALDQNNLDIPFIDCIDILALEVISQCYSIERNDQNVIK